MADLNRQLQEYLAQSKSGTKSQPALGTAVNIEEGAPVQGSWFGTWSSQKGPSAGQGFHWPWTSDPDPCLPGISRSQRLATFGLCIGVSALCFGISALYAPFLLFKARKFALLWSLGSVFALAGAAILRGPSKLLASPTPGAVIYVCSLTGTLYAALSLHSTVLTALGAVLQIAAIVAYIIAQLPGGSAGIRFFGGLTTSVIKRTVSGKTMPI